MTITGQDIAPLTGALDQRQVDLISKINSADSNSVLSFGSVDQTRFQNISQGMLRSVRDLDVQKIDNGMSALVSAVRGFSITHDDLRKKAGFFERMMGRRAPIESFQERLTAINKHVDKVAEELFRSRHRLHVDLRRLEMVYEECQDFYASITDHVKAGRAKLLDISHNDLPLLQARRDAAEGDERMSLERKFHDTIILRDNLERRVHDLELTRIVAMQTLPAIRIIQQNDIELLSKIETMVNTTIPLWEAQMAQAVNMQNALIATRAVGQASAATNEALKANAKAIRGLSGEVRAEIDGGSFDIEAIKTAQRQLVSAIEDSMKVVREGADARAKAEAAFNVVESGAHKVISTRLGASTPQIG